MVDLAERLAKASCCSGVMFWSRKKTTRCSSHAALISLNVVVVQAAEVDAADLGAESARDRLHFDATIGCHGLLLSACIRRGLQLTR